MAAREQRSPLRWSYALDDEEHTDDRQGRWARDDGAEERDGGGEVVTPANRPPDSDEARCRGRDRARG
jgi:hypothetical protein